MVKVVDEATAREAGQIGGMDGQGCLHDYEDRDVQGLRTEIEDNGRVRFI